MAETSLTVPGIVYVVDPVRARATFSLLPFGTVSPISSGVVSPNKVHTRRLTFEHKISDTMQGLLKQKEYDAASGVEALVVRPIRCFETLNFEPLQ